jgi:hypothetical protein
MHRLMRTCILVATGKAGDGFGGVESESTVKATRANILFHAASLS